MGFNIIFKWQGEHADPLERNEQLCAAILERFPGLQRFPLDHDLVAKTLGVPRDDVLKRWCQIELDDPEEKVFGSIMTIWLWGIDIDLPSIASASCVAVLNRLEPLFAILHSHGLALEEQVNLLGAYERHRAGVEAVRRALEKRSKPSAP